MFARVKTADVGFVVICENGWLQDLWGCGSFCWRKIYGNCGSLLALSSEFQFSLKFRIFNQNPLKRSDKKIVKVLLKPNLLKETGRIFIYIRRVWVDVIAQFLLNKLKRFDWIQKSFVIWKYHPISFRKQKFRKTFRIFQS